MIVHNRCRWGHAWGKWEVVRSGTVEARRSTPLPNGDNTRVIGHSLIQQRQCTTCGFIELNIQEVTL